MPLQVRAIMIDTARHWYPVSLILAHLDAMVCLCMPQPQRQPAAELQQVQRAALAHCRHDVVPVPELDIPGAEQHGGVHAGPQ